MVHILLAVIYLGFISLGLPDGLLGSAWPSIFPEMGVPMSYAGIVSIIICVGTILSSLLTEQLTCKLGPGKVALISVALTCVALFGFSASNRFWMLCLWAIPYGLGAGSVDATLNNYVALHYSSRHMSWLHCMWGIGASVGPYIVGFTLSLGRNWSTGYWCVGIVQILLTGILLLSLPLWKKLPSGESTKPIPLKQAVKRRGAKAVMICFLCYSAVEQTAALWSASYLQLHSGFSAEFAASFGSLFFLGITAGRAICGFFAIKLTDHQLISIGLGIIAIGVAILLLPLSKYVSLVGLLLVGLGCAPVYPCIMHATPGYFGAKYSQALMGIQTACGYVGTALLPPLFGFLANRISISLMGLYLAAFLVLLILAYRRLALNNKPTS